MSKKTGIALLVILAVSLLMNGFLLGFTVAGPGWRGEPPMPNPSERMYEAAKELSPENKTKVVAILDKYIPQVDAQREDGMGGFKAIRETLTAQNIDHDELDKLFARMSAHHTKTGKLLDSMIKDIIEALPDNDERAAFFMRALPPEPRFPPPSSSAHKHH